MLSLDAMKKGTEQCSAGLGRPAGIAGVSHCGVASRVSAVLLPFWICRKNST